MATTARDIIADALLTLGVYGPGETISAADAAQGLTSLNDMLDSWSNESLTCYAILEQHFTLQVGVPSYTIGTGGVINQTRPLRILDGPGTAYMMDPQQNRYPIDVVPQDQWNLISSLMADSNVPDTLFYDPQFPLGILNFYPTPNIGWVAYWDSYLQLSEFSNLFSSVNLPPGYNLALKKNLAVFLKPYFQTTQLDPLVIKQAAESLGNIKRTNMRSNVAVYDPEIVSHAQSTYNVYTDSSANRGGS